MVKGPLTPGTTNQGTNGQTGKINNGNGTGIDDEINDNGSTVEQDAESIVKDKKARTFDSEAGTAKIKKRRGRPPKAQVDLEAEVDNPPKKRKPTSDEITGLASQILLANNFVAMNKNAPDFVIRPDEAIKIADPLAEVLAEWGIYLTGLTNPYVALASAIIGVYGTRVINRVMREREVRATQRPQEPPGTGTIIPPDDSKPKGATINLDALREAETRQPSVN